MHKIRLLNVVLPKSKGASLFYFGEHEGTPGKSFFYGNLPFFSRHVTYIVELSEKKRDPKDKKVPGRHYLVQTSEDMVNKTNKVVSNRNAKYIQFHSTQTFMMNPSFTHYGIVKIHGIEFRPFNLSDYDRVMEYLFTYMVYHRFNAQILPELQQKYRMILDEKKETKTTALWGAINTLLVSGDSEAIYTKDMDLYSMNTLGMSLDTQELVTRWTWLHESGLLTGEMLNVKKWAKGNNTGSTSATAYLSNINTKPIIDALYFAIHSCPLWFLSNASTFHVDLRENTISVKQSKDDIFLFPFKKSQYSHRFCKYNH